MCFFIETPCGDVKGAAYEATGWSSPCILAHALYLKSLQEYYLNHALHSVGCNRCTGCDMSDACATSPSKFIWSMSSDRSGVCWMAAMHNFGLSSAELSLDLLDISMWGSFSAGHDTTDCLTSAAECQTATLSPQQ